MDNGGGSKMVLQPLQGLSETQSQQVHDEINGASAASPMVPVYELGPRHRQHALAGVPLARVVRIGLCAAEGQHRGQRHGAELLGPLAPVHGSAESLSRRLTQSLILKTWLDSVSRSIKAAVRWSLFRKDPHSLNPKLDVMSVGFFLCRRCIKVKKSPTWEGSASEYPSSSTWSRSYFRNGGCPCLGPIGLRAKELVEQIGKADITAGWPC